MRFFSNDSKDSNDDQSNVDVQTRAEELNADQAHDDHPERVQSDPVPVPQQRTGSPWADAPAVPADETADAELADQERADGTDESDGGRPPFHEPGPQPTAFGASTVGGAVAASATANPENDRWDVTDRDTDAASGVADDRSVAPGDGAIADEASPWASGPDGEDARRAHAGHARRESGTDDALGAALEDRGTFDDPQVRDDVAGVDRPDTAQADTLSTTDRGTDTGPADEDSARVEGEHALRDEGGFDDPTAVDPVTQERLDGDARDRDLEDRGTGTGIGGEAATGAAVGAAAGAAAGAVAADRSTSAPVTEPAAGSEADTTGVGAPAIVPPSGAAEGARAGDTMPGSVSGMDLGSLFGDDAQTFHERWREVQLRFVDSPKEATRDAAALLDEAVEKLTTSLRGQKDTLMQDSDDTERLRVQLRGYRDMLDRILAL